MHLTTELISRIQFAFTVSFHILFPALSIGLVTFLAVMEGIYLKTRDQQYLKICKFWTKIFALTFGMGVVSGVVMEFQLGTNWSGYTDAVGNVLGALFTYEVLTAFFIEAGALGVMLFGWKKVGEKLHYLSTCLVLIGVTLSAFWILSANSWMQTPAGVSFKNGQFMTDDWLHVIFNPSVLPRFFHMLLAAYISALFVISGICAYYLLHEKHLQFAKKCLSFSVIALAILMPIQIFIGDSVGLAVHDYQPIKTAAMEGIWETQKGAPLLLFAIPDQHAKKNYWEIKIPHGAALVNTHEWNGQLTGLTAVPAKDRPFVPVVFFSFRVMVGCGMLMLMIAWIGCWLQYRQRLLTTRWYLLALEKSIPLGFIALWTGWITAEVGRQPWVVYGYLRTIESSSHVSITHVWITLALMLVVYGIIFGYFYTRFLRKIVAHGPTEIAQTHEPFAYLAAHEVEEK